MRIFSEFYSEFSQNLPRIFSEFSLKFFPEFSLIISRIFSEFLFRIISKSSHNRHRSFSRGMNPTNYFNSNQHNLFHHHNHNENQSNQNKSSHAHDNQSEHRSAHVHPHYHEHHQILYPNNLATHMMAVKISWYRATRSVIETSGAIFLTMGTVVFMTGLLKLLWARSALTSVQAGSYMIGSFLTISSATLGLIGAYQENWCLITSYACVQLSLFVIRTVILMVLIKINYSSGFDDSFKKTKPFSDIPYLISGLPGTSDVVPLELLYSLIEISLCVSAFYISYAINNASKEHIHHESQTYVLPMGENPNVESSNVGSSNVRSSNVRSSNARSSNVLIPNVGSSNVGSSECRKSFRRVQSDSRRMEILSLASVQ